MKNKLATKPTGRFAPSIESLEDRRVLSLLGVQLPALADVVQPTVQETSLVTNLQVDVQLDVNLAQPGQLLQAAVNVGADLQTPILDVTADVGTQLPASSGSIEPLPGLDIGADVNLPPVNSDIDLDVVVNADTGVGVDAGIDRNTDVGAGAGVNIGVDPGDDGISVDVGSSTGSDGTSLGSATIPGDSGESQPTTATSTAATLSPPSFTTAAPVTAPAADSNRVAGSGPGVSDVADAAASVPEAGYSTDAELLGAGGAAAFIPEVATVIPIDEAFRMLDMEMGQFTPEDAALADAAGFAAAEAALQELLNSLTGLSQAFSSWFSLLGPTPWILMGMAALATLSEVTRYRLQRLHERRFHSSW